MTEGRIVVIGSSLGGVRALYELLGALPRDFPAPIAVVQHRGTEGGEELRVMLAKKCPLPLSEPGDKEPIQPGRVYLAPSDYHLLVDEETFALSTETPVNFARPSIDVLFDSAAAAYGRRSVGVVLTGTNRDGAEGAARIKARRGTLLVQDPETAEAREMPAAAIAAAQPDRVLALEQIAGALLALVGRTAP